jgi:hypothetical protein
MRETTLHQVIVRPTDHPEYNRHQCDLTDSDERQWWRTWCESEGEYQVLRHTHTRTELDSIAQMAGYGDWDGVLAAIDSTIDTDGVIAIQCRIRVAATR